MAQTSRSQPFDHQLNDALALAVMYRHGHPTHAQKWDEFGSEEAAIARAAIKVADSLRGTKLDPGEAYLRGIADYHAAQHSLQ